MIHHFSYYRGMRNYAWTELHTLCLMTCQLNAGADEIVVHYDRDGEGPDWEEARALPGIEWKLTRWRTKRVMKEKPPVKGTIAFRSGFLILD